MATRLRRATDDDWRVFVGTLPPSYWVGLVAENEFMLLGIGGLFFGTDDRWWATFARAPGIRSTLTAHRAARMVMDIAKEAGLTVHAMADLSIDGAELWLRRLGFVETDEILNDCRVWKWVLNS